jgi:hypothetical protein
MKKEELKHVVIFAVLKKHKGVQQAAVRLGKTKDWAILKQFVVDVKQKLMEASFESNKPLENAKYRYLIKGMEGVIVLPKLVEFIKEMAKEDKISKEEREKEAKRRKFNPGAFVRGVIKREGK